jgi:hypothetical protein
MRGPKYPLTIAIRDGRVQHSARWLTEGKTVITLCGKRGFADARAGLRFCQACAKRPNPQDQRSYLPPDSTTEK